MHQRSGLLIAGIITLLAGPVAAAPDASAPHQDHDGRDGGARAAVDAGPPETKDQRAYRMRYVSDTSQKENSLLKDLVWTPEVHKAVNEHWRRAYRTLRIRELAEDGNDADTVTRTDLYLRKIDGHFFGYLAELAPTLPTIPAAPTITSPAPQAQIPIGSALSIAFTPAAGQTPTDYLCIASEGGAYLSNFDQAAKHWGTANPCTFSATDPKWSKFVAKKGGIWVAAGTKTKSPKGVDYIIWSRQRYIPVQYTGGSAAPATSGGAK